MGFWLKPSLGLLVSLLVTAPALAAEPSLSITTPQGQTLEITGKDRSRADNTLILYTRDYGKTTRTNPHGVEVVAVPAQPNPSPGLAQRYQVRQITSVWECQKKARSQDAACGNAEIPKNGVVLSAAGNQRQGLLSSLSVGQTFEVKQVWVRERTLPISIINPTPQNNPSGSGFPGYRASHQLIVYDAGYGQPRTGTNEFGFEVTVVNGIVVAQEGSDSLIPPEGYVLSGHGRARDWLIANAPLGAKIQQVPNPEKGSSLTSRVDDETYRYQLTRRLEDTQARLTPKTLAEIRQAEAKATLLHLQGQEEAATELTVNALETLNRAVWATYAPFEQGAIRAAWHRPVEKSAAAIGQTLDSLKAAGFNTVFLETFFHGYPIFPSKTYRDEGIPDDQNPKFKGIDLLKVWLDEAHHRNMKVHAWFQTFYVGTTAFQAPGPILTRHPDWANVQYSALSQNKPTASTLETGGYFLDPANPEVQAFLFKLIEELVTRYPLDGFQFDYIRYPASFPPNRYSYLQTSWGYTPVARQCFQAQTGVDPASLTPAQTELWAQWNQFKVKTISQFVQLASGLIRAKRPDILISADIFPNLEESLGRKHQDWATWAKNGWVDFLAPMTLTSAAKVIESDTQRVITETQGKVPVVAGVFGAFNNNTAEDVLEQIDTARKAGAAGVSLFDTAHLSGRMLEALGASSHGKPSQKNARK